MNLHEKEWELFPFAEKSSVPSVFSVVENPFNP
jgi:hypothetical protein